MSNVSDIFMEIVQIDSVTGEEEDMTKYLNNFLTNHYKLKTFIDKNNNVFSQVQGSGEPILFCAHTDTVEPGKNIKPQLKNGIISSQGKTILGADNKAAVAAILSALDHIIKNKDNKPIDIIFTTSEEVGNYGAIGFNKQKIRAKTGFIFDDSSPVGTIIKASPFYARYDINIIGKSAHAGYPMQAIPSIPTMLEVINQIESLRNKDLLVNIGILNGGSARNTIIGNISLRGEIRCYHKNIFEKAILSLEKIFSEKYDCRLETEIVIENTGYIHSKPSLKKIKKQIDFILKDDVKIKWSYGVSDANIFNETKNIEVYNLGDGSFDSHTINEYISVDSLEKIRELIIGLSLNQTPRKESNNV